jgi:hypothetical protein
MYQEATQLVSRPRSSEAKRAEARDVKAPSSAATRPNIAAFTTSRNRPSVSTVTQREQDR